MMSTTLSQDEQEAKDLASDSAAVGIAYAFGGVVLGFVSICFAMLVVGLSVALVQGVTGKDTCADGFGTAITIALVAFGVLVTLAVGRKLYGWRKYVGAHGGPEEEEFAAMIRKRFTFGSMIVYCLMLPASWLLILAAANCSGTL